MSVYCTLFSQTFYGLLFCYLTNVHVTLYLQIIDFQFPSCCTSQPPKKLNQTITVNSSTNTPRSYHRKNNSCTLCMPMFNLVYVLIRSFVQQENRSLSTVLTVFIILLYVRPNILQWHYSLGCQALGKLQICFISDQNICRWIYQKTPADILFLADWFRRFCDALM